MIQVSEVFQYTGEQIEAHWPSIDEALEADTSLWDSMYSKLALMEGFQSGFIQLWGVSSSDAVHALFMTRVFEVPAGKTVQLFWMFGREVVSQLGNLDTVMDRFAASAGATRIEIVGRKGWEKLLKPLGFEFATISVARPVKVLKDS